MRRADSRWWISTFILAGGLLLFQASGAIAQQQMPQMPQGMMGPGMMGQGMMGQGMMGQGMMGPGMMGSGPMGQGMMGPGMMGSGMMGPGAMGMGTGCPAMGEGGMMSGMMSGMMGHGGMGAGMMAHGMMGDGMGAGMMGGGRLIMVPAPPLLSVADVTYNLERLLAARGNARLKVGPVTEKDEATIIGDIVTTEGSLVERYEVDRRTGVAAMVP